MRDQWIIPNSAAGMPDHEVGLTGETGWPVGISVAGYPPYSLAPAEARAIATALTTAADLAEGKR
ncbi:MAG: hypothetical protein QM804_10170 [Propionicimonas sp.]